MKKIRIDNLHHRSSSAKNIKSNNAKKNQNKNIINEFKKINILGTTNTSGIQPIIIYKKECNNNNNNNNIKQIKISSNNNNNNIYISDGGLKKKLDRYNSGHSYSIPNKKTSSSKNEKKSKKFYPKKKKTSKPPTHEKLFSQTMISSFKRPKIPKKEKINKIKNNPITNYVNEIKEKNKENKKMNKPLKNQPKNLSESCMIDIENKKLERMNKLVENAIVYEMRKNQIETEKKQISLKDKISFRKKGYLEENGIETTWTIEEEKEYDINNENKEKDKDKEKDKENDKKDNNTEQLKDSKSKPKKKPKTEINSNSHTINVGSSNCINYNYNYNNLVNSNSNEEDQLTLDITKKHKKILKPKVNQFEFLKKIQEEQKKLPFHIELSNHNKRQINKNMSTSAKINDSFRHKSITFKPNPSENNIFEVNDSKKYPTIQFKEKESENNTNITDDFPFAGKKNNRKIEELTEFIRKKKIKQKKEEETKEYEKKKKLFEIFKNLSNLKDSYNSSNYTNINNSTSLFKRRNKNNTLKKKEINAYYIGTDSSRNGSTILDLNEYYLNILESQQLLVNSGLNKISDLSLNIENIENIENFEEGEENKDNNINNINNINSDEYCNQNINNDYFSSNNINNNNSSNNTNFIYGNYNNEELKQINNILNNNNYQDKDKDNITDNEINNQINNTVNRVNELMFPKNIENNVLLSYSQNINNENKEIKTDNELSNRITNDKKAKEKKFENINLENIDNKANNINNTTSELNTKERELPSLPHTFSNNTNPNKRVEIDIQPCAVLNLVEILRLIIQRKVFFRLCQLYINHSISQRYIIAFSYFVAICKQFPFKTIEDYSNYKTYYYAFRQLFRPFIRLNFKIFLNNCISVTKIGYFVELLSRMYKFKSMERIYIYSQLKEENEELKAVCQIILKIILTMCRPFLKMYFLEFCNNINKKINEKEKEKPSLNIDIDTLEFIPFCKKKKNNSTRINSFMYE